MTSDSNQFIKMAAWIYSNMVASTDIKISEILVDKFLEQGPVDSFLDYIAGNKTKVIKGEQYYDISVLKECLYTICNTINCGSKKQAKDLFLMSFKNAENDESAAAENFDENLLIKGLIRGIKNN